MSRYGDDFKCTCEMEFVSCVNKYHADSCELWLEPSFKDGSDEWDGDLGCLVLSRSPWDMPEEFVWNGDTPVIRKSTAEERITAEVHGAIEKWIGDRTTDVTTGTSPIEIISELEQEVLDQLNADPGTIDDLGLICLKDGSFADFELRVTYRKVTGDDGGISWTEMFWDDPINLTLEEWESGAVVKATVVECICLTPKKFYCHVCKVQRDKEDGPWRPWAGHNTSGNTYSAKPWQENNDKDWYWHKCAHCFDPFELPGGQDYDIRISAKREHGPETTPDYGLYAYSGWYPKCVHTFIPWQDYGLPTVEFEKAARAIKDAWMRAAEGETVEVGCMGGHGRTGTILACIAILSDPEMTSKQAISHVRKTHCHEAIETNQQEWFIEWFRCWYLGETCVPMPTTYVSKHSKNWSTASKAAVAVKSSEATLPLAPSQGKSPAGGAFTKVNAIWCSHCMRTVHVQHNAGCPLDDVSDVEQQALTFDTALYNAGDTANKRRRNAKRANRRAAKRRRQAEKMSKTHLQEVM